MREETQLRIIVEVIKTYDGKEPLSRFLKKYFNLNRQLGSRDRRLIQQFGYNYFRIGKLYADKSIQERLGIANKLCKAEETPLLNFSFKDLANIERLASHIEPDKLFPLIRHVSDSINKTDFIHSFLVQPKVWIRVREKFTAQVEKELAEKNIPFEKDTERKNTWSLKNTTSLDQLDFFLKGYFEIQDFSSQKTIDFIKPKPNEMWWDACAGAGGKSLMMADFEPTVNLLCTDSRETILKNLKERFTKASVKNFKAVVMDLLTPNLKPQTSNPLDGIVADVPCSGSGTWSRSPEWLTFFNHMSIEKYQLLQRKIVSAVTSFLPEGKPLVYITCSVFKEENEENISWITSNLPLKLQTQAYIEGATQGADTMFAARLIKI